MFPAESYGGCDGIVVIPENCDGFRAMDDHRPPAPNGYLVERLRLFNRVYGAIDAGIWIPIFEIGMRRKPRDVIIMRNVLKMMSNPLDDRMIARPHEAIY